MFDKVSVNYPNNIFPSVNYIGNKTKLSDWISSNLPLKEGTILDLFAGGSSVSYSLKKLGYRVISNDALYASYVVNKALIENSNSKLSMEDINSAINEKYFDERLRQKVSWLDNKLYFPEEVDELTRLINYSIDMQEYEKYMFLSLLRRSMIRKLPYSRMNLDWKNIKKLRDEDYSYEKYGRKRAYHNQSFSHHMKIELNKYNSAVFDNKRKNIVSQMDSLSALEYHNNYDIVYLDPPYPGTMNNYDAFYGAFDDIFSKKIPYSDWTKPDAFMSNLDKALQLASQKAEYFILSLNSNTKPGVENIRGLLLKYGVVEIKEKKHNYQVSGKQNKNKNKELLMILRFTTMEQLTIFNYL